MVQIVCSRRRLPITGALVLTALLVSLKLPATTAADTALQPEEGHGVSISAFTFEPAAMTVNAGEEVTWVNTDGVPHTSTAALNHQWGQLMTRGESFSYTFDTPGTYAYFCEMHPAMVGTITVVAE
jgi:plastocyanin